MQLEVTAARGRGVRERLARRLEGLDFELLASLPRPPRVIFTTADDEYAFRAFEVSAVDYLLKPIDAARLAQALRRLCEPAAEIAPRVATTRRLGEDDQVLLRDGDNCWFVRLREVQVFEAEGNYTRRFRRPACPRAPFA